jgi:hypothetical protein
MAFNINNIEFFEFENSNKYKWKHSLDFWLFRSCLWEELVLGAGY